MRRFLPLPRIAAPAVIAVTTLAVFPGIITAQGPLTPPGPPAPTMQTLDQIGSKTDQANNGITTANSKLDSVANMLGKRTPISALPFTISTSGSYYLTGNLTATADGDAITVSGDNVTIDLNGFN